MITSTSGFVAEHQTTIDFLEAGLDDGRRILRVLKTTWTATADDPPARRELRTAVDGYLDLCDETSEMEGRRAIRAHAARIRAAIRA